MENEVNNKIIGKEILTNDSDLDDEIEEAMEQYVDMTTDKRVFYLSISCGSVVPITSPDYYIDRKEIILEKDIVNNQINKAEVNIEGKTYNVNANTFDEIIAFTKENYNRLLQIAANQSTDVYFGGGNSIIIKINSILISVSPLNTKNSEDKVFLNQYEEKIVNIILNNQ